jgi:hypothetical protein
MRAGTLIEEKTFCVPCNMIVNFLRRLEVNIVEIPHKLSVIRHRIVSRKVYPIRKTILEFNALHFQNFLFL